MIESVISRWRHGSCLVCNGWNANDPQSAIPTSPRGWVETWNDRESTVEHFPRSWRWSASLSIASECLAQGNTFNPYGNSGYADYREFGNAMYSTTRPFPARLSSTPNP